MPYPLCSSFSPTILEGQLCYKIQLNQTSGDGQENELFLLLDYNDDYWLYSLDQVQKQFDRKREEKDSTDYKHINTGSADEAFPYTRAKIQVDALSPGVGFGQGHLKLWNVKRIAAKNDFLNMPLEVRNCGTEAYQECRTRKLFEMCKCVPWELSHIQVRIMYK